MMHAKDVFIASGMHDTCISVADKVILGKEISKSVRFFLKISDRRTKKDNYLTIVPRPKGVTLKKLKHTNSYAQEKIFGGLGSSYTISDGSWQDVTADEIRRFIVMLIHFGVVHVRGDVQKNWSTKSLYHGHWARAILPCARYFAILAMLHVVDPATEEPQNKLRKVESFIEDIKKLCKELYLPQKYGKVSSQVWVSPVHKGQANQMGYKTLGAGG